jgi:hypothetical protein
MLNLSYSLKTKPKLLSLNFSRSSALTLLTTFFSSATAWRARLANKSAVRAQRFTASSQECVCKLVASRLRAAQFTRRRSLMSHSIGSIVLTIVRSLYFGISELPIENSNYSFYQYLEAQLFLALHHKSDHGNSCLIITKRNPTGKTHLIGPLIGDKAYIRNRFG